MGRKKDKYGEASPIEYPSNSARFSEISIPIRKRKKYYGSMLRIIFLSGVTLFILMMTLAGLFTYRLGALTQENEDQLESSYNPSFRTRYDDLGSQVIQSWFNQREPVISYASNIEWPGTELDPEQPTTDPWPMGDDEYVPQVNHVSFISGEQNSADVDEQLAEEYPKYANPYEEVLTYYAVYNGQPVNITINLVVPDVENLDEQPILVSTPTIAPADRYSAHDSITSQPEGSSLQEVETTESIDSAINDWAEAWAQNESATLKQITQDDTDLVYLGLGGWELSEDTAEVNWAYERSFGQEADGLFYVAEVQFDIEQVIVEPAESEEEEEEEEEEDETFTYTVSQTMNVLIENPESQLPAIVSWGPSGSWKDLSPYSVGIDPEDLAEFEEGTTEEEDDLEDDGTVEEDTEDVTEDESADDDASQEPDNASDLEEGSDDDGDESESN